MQNRMRLWLISAGALFAAAVGLGFSGSASATVCEAIAGNLVTNCGFETGSFSGWTTTPAAQGSIFGVDGFPNSGAFAAFFEAVTPPFADTISQNIPTVVGQNYTISFFLENLGGSPNHFVASFGGSTLLSVTDLAAFPYEQITQNVVASGSATTLSFSAYQVPSSFRLDDISVVSRAIPEPSSIALLGSALFALGAIRRRRRNL